MRWRHGSRGRGGRQQPGKAGGHAGLIVAFRPAQDAHACRIAGAEATRRRGCALTARGVAARAACEMSPAQVMPRAGGISSVGAPSRPSLAKLRSASDSSPMRAATVMISAARGDTSSDAVLARVLALSASLGRAMVRPTAMTRRPVAMVSLTTAWPGDASRIDWVRIRSIKSPGWIRPELPDTSVIGTEIARMPGFRAAARKPGVSAAITSSRRIGAPAASGWRTSAPFSCASLSVSLRVMAPFGT